MIKSRERDGDGYKMVHYELSRGGYDTEDDEVALPNYLVHLPSQKYGIVDIDVVEELNYRGNDGYSDDVGDYAR